MNRFVLVALPALAISLAAATPATAAKLRVASFGGGAEWVETTTPPPGASDPSSIDLSVQGSSAATVTLTGFGQRPPAVSPSYDFRPSVSGPSGGSPRLTMRLSDGGGDLRPVNLVAGEWTHQDGSTDWDSYGGSCGFRAQLSYGEFLGCHPGARVIGLEFWNDSGWLYPSGFRLLVDNVTYGGDTISSQDTDVLRGGPAESPQVTAEPTDEVLVRLPRDQGSGEFVPLEEVAEVPVGSVVDAEEGSIELSTAPDTSGRLVSADVSEGVFQILQPRRRPQDAGVTELRMRRTSRRGCPRGRAQAASLPATLSLKTHRKKKKKKKGKKAHRSAVTAAAVSPQGGFRVRTRNSTTRAWEATWRTVDRCDGTLTRVTRGRVLLRDLHRKHSEVLRAGGRYLARVP